MTQSLSQNSLLDALSTDDFAQLRPHLRPMTTHLHQPLIAPHRPIEQVFFPLTGFASVTNDDDLNRIEVGIIGSEGLIGAPLLLGSDRTPLDHFVQVAGEMLYIDAADFREAVAQSSSMRDMFLRFVQTLLVQTAQTAFVNASFGIETRLARWLLMCQDRTEGDSLLVTHEFLSTMLGVQRTSVTIAVQALEGSLLIRARRGRIEIRDREKLKELAHVSYGVPETEYRRLIRRA